MTPTKLTDVLTRLLSGQWPAFVWGPPGIGKSSIVRGVAASAGLRLVDVRAPLLDPTDIRGIPVPDAGRAVWLPPSFLPRDGEGVLFLDELNAAPPLVQASLYQLTLDRAVGEYRLPAGWRIIAAGNRAQDGSIAFRMPSALANRFVHLECEPSAADWRAWAVGAGIHPLVLGFIATRPALLFDMSRAERGFPTPRSWHMLSDALHAFSGHGDLDDVAVGIVGEGAATEFLAYARSAMTEQAIAVIVADPERAELPASIGDVYALISWLAVHAGEAAIRRSAALLLPRLQPEMAVLLARDVLRRDARFALERAYLAFVKEHKDFLK
jgi:hypothetical protein